MRYVLPLFAVAAGAIVVVACSSDDEKTPNTPATIAPLGDGGGADDDDDKSPSDAGCSSVKSLDCAAQAAHAKEGSCAAFDEKDFTESCEAQNCGTPDSCGSQLKAYGDCLLAQPVKCASDGTVSADTPPECKDQEGALFGCLTQQ